MSRRARAPGGECWVDRLWPRGVKKESAGIDEWMREIGPSDGLQKWFGHEPERRPEFQKRYRSELEEKSDLIGKIRKAEKEHGTVTLLFGAKDQEHNQAVVLRDVLKARA